MQKITPFYVVSLFLITLITGTGCAKQGVIKNDEHIVPTAVSTQAEPSKSGQTKTPLSSRDQIEAATGTPIATSSATPGSPAVQIVDSNALQSSLDKIYFNFDTASLSDSARTVLTGNAGVLARKTSTKIRIEGNCDERGSAEYNLALGERRALAAHQYLATLGVNPERLTTVSYGKEKPVTSGSDEASWAKNRRVEFVVLTH